MGSDIYRSLKSVLDKGKKAAIVTFMNDVNSSHNKIIITEEQLQTSGTIANKVQSALKTGKVQYFKASNGTSILIEPYFPEPRLIILGGGNIAQSLTEFGSRVGFMVTVVDDRPKFANKSRFPDAEKVICDSFNNCFSKLDLNEFSSVVIVTRGQRNDMDCLKQVLNYKTAYTGMIGSKHRVNIVKEQLLNEGYSDKLINKINAPIGLEIGAITPEEIAISIIAQVISFRRRLSTSAAGSAPVKVNGPDPDRSVLEELCRDADDPKALVTIIETKGSVPRQAGAKMLVWPYGKTVGSIGGGCAEGEVINIAWDIIKSGGFMIHDIDMTGQVAEDDGMICGGVMRVLIEDYN